MARAERIGQQPSLLMVGMIQLRLIQLGVSTAREMLGVAARAMAKAIRKRRRVECLWLVQLLRILITTPLTVVKAASSC